MKRIFVLGPLAAFMVSCSTLDQSLRLGAATGALTGFAAAYAGQNSVERQPTNEEAGSGAAIGLGLGLITSYIIHQQVVSDRNESARQTDIYFGDLPPSPFVYPSPTIKKGNR